jgi:O-antigen biosynthesis protein
LEQCLHSVRKAAERIETEIWVVDNNSVDHSVEMVQQRFPEVRIIANKENAGFSKANNQAIRESGGEYVLLLNPDTVVEEDTFLKVVTFMDAHPDAGGLGVKMIDGSGAFLPESKRGLPTYDVAFYKIFGLSRFFPKSKIFGRYHLGFIDENETSEIEILAGAFMLMRRSALDKTGLLDEDFFMYGEDIDLSYRILKAGYKNYYFPQTRIIHYKGESTKRSSVNYVFVFYNAMIIFAKKHFSKSNASLFSMLIRFAIYIRATAAIVNRFIKKALLPLLDLAFLFLGIYLLKQYWGRNFNIHYPPVFMYRIVPSYCAIWITTVFFSGGYDLPIRFSRILRGVFTGTLIILVAYALLPEEKRYSRALILLGAVWSGSAMIGIRFFLNLVFGKTFPLASTTAKRLLIVGNDEEGSRVLSLLKLSDTSHNFIGFIRPEESNAKSFSPEYQRYFLGTTDKLKELTDLFAIEEIIFCGKDISSQQIIDYMSRIPGKDVEYKIAPPESMFIIGSSNVENPGELYVVDINNINKAVNKRNKRLIDILSAISLLFLSPILILFQKKPIRFISNIFSVISGKKTWVGYVAADVNLKALPEIRTGVLSPLDYLHKNSADALTISRLNSLYAKDYRIYTDLNILRKGWRKLGQ